MRQNTGNSATPQSFYPNHPPPPPLTTLNLHPYPCPSTAGVPKFCLFHADMQNVFSFQGSGSQVNSNTFIFSLRNTHGTAPFKASPIRSACHVYIASNYGPTFGGGHDIHIGGDSYTNFGHTYTAPVSMSNPQTFLAGVNHFTPTEVEVFYLSNN